MASRILVASLLISLLLVSYAAESFESETTRTGRELQMKQKGKGKGKEKGKTAKEKEAAAEAKREAMALKEFAKLQQRKEKEKQAVLRAARKEAQMIIERFNRANNQDGQVKVFLNLWKNAKGPAILIALTTLVSSSQKSAPVFLKVVALSMLEADEKGFSFQVADGLWTALTHVENEEAGGPLLDAILINLRSKNKARKDSGCTYVRNLFTDAEVLAIENGYELEFARAIDTKRHIPLAECFYGTCTKDALECCKDEDTIVAGRCNCSKKEPNMCDFNLFFNTPRPIWRCNGEGCNTPKCMCPFQKKKKAKGANGGKPKRRRANGKPKGKAKTSVKPRGKGKGKPKKPSL